MSAEALKLLSDIGLLLGIAASLITIVLAIPQVRRWAARKLLAPLDQRLDPLKGMAGKLVEANDKEVLLLAELSEGLSGHDETLRTLSGKVDTVDSTMQILLTKIFTAEDFVKIVIAIRSHDGANSGLNGGLGKHGGHGSVTG